jgi:Fe2+ or Zn2+ uptake regulation protein
MELDRFMRCMRSRMHRRILQMLAEEDMSAPQVYGKLGNYAPKYRQSVNKALELLRESGLLSKYYNAEKKKLCYHLIKKKYTIDLAEMKVE